MPEFTHLHNHSYFSLLDGLASPDDLIDCAVEMGYKSLALTDHGSCAGLFQFQKHAKEKGIKPILGMEAYICKDYRNKDKETAGKNHHLVILAKNKKGYENLIYLSSFAYIDGFYYKPRISFDILEKHSEGLIISSACSNGEVAYALSQGDEGKAIEIAGKYKEVFKDDFYIEIMTHSYYLDKDQEIKEKNLAILLYRLSKKLGIKAICTQDTHYARKDDWEAHDVLLSIQTLDTVKNPNRLSFGSKDFYLKNADEMASIYKKAPELLLNTVEIAEKIEENLIEKGSDLLPTFKVPDGFSDEESYLKAIVSDGMKEKGLASKPEYVERIQFEMSVIIRCKYTKYFLILWDIVNFARINGIRLGAGRGSAVGSLCLYVMGVTKLDPLQYDLLFERFLNPERVSPPDVDLDFDFDRRNEVYQYIISKYGSDHCCQIGTYNQFKAKAVIRSTVKALDLAKDWEIYQEEKKKNPNGKIAMGKRSLDMADTISKLIPMKPGTTIVSAAKSCEEFKYYMEKYPKLLKCVQKIEGTISSAGVHPAGILVCKDPIITKVPMRNSKGVTCTQFDGPEVEDLGLLKYDLLALKTLTVIDKTLKMIKERHGKDIDIDNLVPNDAAIFRMLNGKDRLRDAKGVFQFEADGISRLLADIRVDRFEDMIVANALYRPGPLMAGVHNMYCDFKHGRKAIEYLHPKMGEVLKDSYGIMVYQEHIMRVSQKLAGFTGGQADTLRKAVGKKKKDLLAEQEQLFVNGCIKNGIDKPVAKEIFKQIDYFGGYGFNKSHSAAYAFIAYQCAWLKIYYPIEFMCNLLTSEINNNDKDEKMNSYFTAVGKMGIKIYRTNLNKSGTEFVIDTIQDKKTGKTEEVLRSPLTSLDGVGEKAVANIVANRPYKDLEEFLKKTDQRLVNSRVFKKLVECGSMDGALAESREVLLSKYDEMKKKIDKDKKAKKKEDEMREKNKNKINLWDEDFGISPEGLKV